MRYATCFVGVDTYPMSNKIYVCVTYTYLTRHGVSELVLGI